MLKFSQNYIDNFQNQKEKAAAVILINNGKALILQRGNTAPWMPGAWNLPGGAVDKGETSEQAAIRECQEEAGITPSGLTLFRSYNDPEFDLDIYVGQINNSNILINWESQSSHWVSLQELGKFTFVPYVGQALQEVLQGQ